MTPVVKALFTDLGFEAANLGVQVYGGHGYIREHGVEQFVRDARIAQIYEGTNGIQALDLVGRKLPANMGRLLRRFFHPVSRLHRGHAGARTRRSAAWSAACEQAFGALQLATAHDRADGHEGPRGSRRRRDRLSAPARPGRRSATCFVARGRRSRPASWPTARTTTRASTRPSSPPRSFFFDRILPQATAMFLAIKSGKRSLMALDEAAF